ncbi:dihydroorotate dehydrogenase-like protein [Halieaceae bacterium IMCC14734]|uniref:Dihydroorotate dehydrogenase-like protein n=1 Tax=Candidatus Litorirhabdus singularis TaxID=2518993 RepID=A0ABT3TMQ7_9GAMM|nr:dihydroorotate dehydrogenase-like protein [Candidatus Litorirhabdus singularis]MCX2982607.1 dihydroorotate dehydrogenase-like protein [Candidatus Litorirhabdus singularis]
MQTLQTQYLGMTLKNPLVPSASPLSRDLDSARHLEDAGASALVMHSLFEEELIAEEKKLERFFYHQDLGHHESSSFLPLPDNYRSGLDTYLEHLQQLKSHLQVPVIGSLNGITDAGWIEYAKELQDAGADALELNVYYIAANILESAEDVEQRYINMLRKLLDVVSIPVTVKLSPQFSSPVHFAHQLQQTGVAGIALFNRFYQCDINLETLAVEPQLQLSSPYEALLRVRWTAIMRGQLDIDIAVTGGFHNTPDIIKALLAGANVVHLCSALLQQGSQRISTLLDEMRQWLEDNEYDSVQQMQGSLSQTNAADPGAFERSNYRHVLQSWTPPPGVRY